MNLISTIRVHQDLPVQRDRYGNVDLLHYQRRARQLRSQLAWHWLGLGWARLRRLGQPTPHRAPCHG